MSTAGASEVSILGVIDEVSRHRAIDELHLLESRAEDRFERVARLARELFGVKTALITLIDGDTQHFKAGPLTSVEKIRLEDSICRATIRQEDTFVVSDASKDVRFANDLYVTANNGVRFYAGHPLFAPGGEPIGTLCIADPVPRGFSNAERILLADLAMWTQNEMSVAQELDRAARVQRSLLPKQLMSLPGFDVAGGCAPAQAVGGDFYDWYPVGEGAAFTLADVMGKGIGAAIIAATVRAVLRSGSRHKEIVGSVDAAASILEGDLDEAGTFVTLFHARLDMDTGTVRYVDAGHGLSLVVFADGRTKRLATTSFPLGVDGDDTRREHRVTLLPGDTLVTFSDGVLDLFDGTLASLDEIEKLVRAAPNAQAIVDTLLALAGSNAPDDVTVVAVRRDR
ncbi:MAG: protein serine phosphatase with sensor(S) [Glaciihabitans sp.]|nr:protein serine phosphatase with sensor(S) [Glaciihabitans sp.]